MFINSRENNLLVQFLTIETNIFISFKGTSVLSKHITPEILPKDYGGSADYTLEDLNDYWQDILVENREWFVDESLHNSDENKRPTDSKYKPEETPCGVDGSFKQLSID